MAESTLTLSLTDFRHSVAEFLYGGDGRYEDLIPAEQDRVDRCVDDGLRQFYNPTSIGDGRVHEWSFLRPTYDLTLNAAYTTGTVTIVAGVVTLASGTWPSWAASGQLMVGGIDYSVNTRDSDSQVTLDDLTVTAAAGTSYSLHQDDYDLPAGFSDFIGPLTFRQADNAWWKVKLVGEGRIRYFRQLRTYGNFSINQPWEAAIRTKAFDATVGQRSEILFWPRVVSAAVVTFMYRVRPDKLTPTNLYPYGCSDHSDTIMASMLAVAEQKEHEQRGTYWDQFQRLLQSSIALDSRSNVEQSLGYAIDNSDNMVDPFAFRHVFPNQPTYTGGGPVSP